MSRSTSARSPALIAGTSLSTDFVLIGLVPRLDQARDRIETVASSNFERRFIPVVSDCRPRAAFQEQPNHGLMLVHDRIHERRVPENGGLLVDERSVIE